MNGTLRTASVATVAGGASAFGTTLVSGVLVEFGIGAGTVSYEMGFLLALFLASLAGPFAGLLGAAIGRASRSIPSAMGWCAGFFAGSAVSAVAFAVFYQTVVAAHATVPHRHVVWVGVISVVGVATGGGVGAIIGRCSGRSPVNEV